MCTLYNLHTHNFKRKMEYVAGGKLQAAVVYYTQCLNIQYTMLGSFHMESYSNNKTVTWFLKLEEWLLKIRNSTVTSKTA